MGIEGTMSQKLECKEPVELKGVVSFRYLDNVFEGVIEGLMADADYSDNSEAKAIADKVAVELMYIRLQVARNLLEDNGII